MIRELLNAVGIVTPGQFEERQKQREKSLDAAFAFSAAIRDKADLLRTEGRGDIADAVLATGARLMMNERADFSELDPTIVAVEAFGVTDDQKMHFSVTQIVQNTAKGMTF